MIACVVTLTRYTAGFLLRVTIPSLGRGKWAAPKKETAAVMSEIRRQQSAFGVFLQAVVHAPPSVMGAGFLAVFACLLSLSLSVRVVVVGGSGKTGRLVVETCLSDPRCSQVTVAAKSLSRARSLFGRDSERLAVLPCDVTDQDPRRLRAVLDKADAVICTAAYSPSSGFDPLGALRVDGLGVRRLIDACVDARVPKFVLCSSLLTNGLAAGQLLNPQYLLLNAVGGILSVKRSTELYLQRQHEIDFTIVRPGGLTDLSPSHPVLYGSADTIFGGAISRQTVAKILVESAFSHQASNKIVEVIESANAIEATFDFALKNVQ